MKDSPHPSACGFLAEALLYPDDRDPGRLESLAAAAAEAPEFNAPIESLLASPEFGCCDLYLRTFEIAPRAPLYLGHYLFKEPDNCRGAGMSGRNAYMIQLTNVYRHFGYQIDGAELPDFLPLMLEFLSLSAGHPDQKRRQWMIGYYMEPAVPAFSQGLKQAGTVYSAAADILEELFAPKSVSRQPTPAVAGQCLKV